MIIISKKNLINQDIDEFSWRNSPITSGITPISCINFIICIYIFLNNLVNSESSIITKNQNIFTCLR